MYTCKQYLNNWNSSFKMQMFKQKPFVKPCGAPHHTFVIIANLYIINKFIVWWKMQKKGGLIYMSYRKHTNACVIFTRFRYTEFALKNKQKNNNNNKHGGRSYFILYTWKQLVAQKSAIYNKLNGLKLCFRILTNHWVK